MQIGEKLQEYLINSLLRDKERAEAEAESKNEVIEKVSDSKTELLIELENWRHKFLKLEDEVCEYKKKVKRLEADKTFHINELQKRNNLFKENETLTKKAKELEDKVVELEEELLKKVLVECGSKKMGRPKKELNNV